MSSKIPAGGEEAGTPTYIYALAIVVGIFVVKSVVTKFLMGPSWKERV